MRYVIANGLETVNGKTVIKKCRYATLPSVLPSGYTQVKYIESTGTQYIDSGFLSTVNSILTCDVAFTQTSGSQVNGIYSTSCRIQFGILNGHYWFGVADKQITTSVVPDLAKHTFTVDIKNKQYGLDNNLTTDSSIIVAGNSKSLLLFCMLNATSNTPVYYCKQKLYSCKIYDNDVLVRNFIPCYRDADNKPGLYDLVEGVFYTNQGTGEFIYETLNNIYSSESRTVIVSDSGLSGDGWSDANLNETSFSAHNNYTTVLYEFTETGFNIRPSNIEFLNGSGLQLPFKVIGNREYRLTFNYDGPNVSSEFWYYNQSGIKIGGSSFTNDTTITVPANAMWVVFNFRAAATEDFVHYTNVRFEHKSSPISSVAVSPRLPDDYQEVTNIIINNNQANGYINGVITNISWANIKKIEVKLQTLSYSIGHSSTSNQNIIFRASDNIESPQSAYSPYINLSNGNSSPILNDITGSCTSEYNTDKLLIEEQYLSFAIFSSSTKKLTIGCWNDSAYSACNKFYFIKVYGENNILCDLIPCYRKSDNAPGFYDVVNKCFYENFGTGTFLKGNNVVAGGSSDIYYGYNQKIDNGLFSSSYNTIGWNGIEASISLVDGKLRCTPSTKTLCGFKQDNFKGIVGHKYYIDVQGIDLSNIVNDNTTQIIFSMNAANAYFIYRTTDLSITNWNTIYTCPETGSSYLTLFRIYLTFNNGTHSGYFDIGSVSIIDLTDWYGAGKEPSTVQEFKEKFTKEYYPHCKDVKMLSAIDINNLGVD